MALFRTVVLLSVLFSVSASAMRAPWGIRAENNTRLPLPPIFPTTKGPNGIGGDPSVGNKVCTAFDKCWSNEDCHGGSCTGINIAKCSCTCASFVQCTSDAACGGFEGACDKNAGRCDCEKAFTNHGFSSLLAATQQFCGHKACTKDGNDCLGMPCGAGACICPLGRR